MKKQEFGNPAVSTGRIEEVLNDLPTSNSHSKINPSDIWALCRALVAEST